MKMKAAVIHEQGLPRPTPTAGRSGIEEVDLDAPGEGEVLVKVPAAGLCQSDLATIENCRTRTLPIVRGHEGAGVVAEVGRGASPT